MLKSEEARHPHARYRHRQGLEGFRQGQRRIPTGCRRARRMGRPESRAGEEALRRLQGAADWLEKHVRDDAHLLIFPKTSPADQKDIASLIRAKDWLGLSLAGATRSGKKSRRVYKAGIDVGYRQDAVGRVDLRQAGAMITSARRSQIINGAGSTDRAPGAVAGRVTPRRLICSSRCRTCSRRTLQIPSICRSWWRCSKPRRASSPDCSARFSRGLLALDRPLGAVRELEQPVLVFLQGIPGAVVGGDRRHLRFSGSIPHLLHHGHHHAAGLHLPRISRRLPFDVEGPVR